MDLRIPPFRAVRMVIHWFSLWDNLERQLFLSTLSSLEGIDPHLSTEQQPITDSNDYNDNVSDQMMDIFLADLMNSNLQINYAPSTVFECQLRSFRNWYPQWPMEQRLQLAYSLKEIQLRSTG
uniref:Uncharacterized protein n=1 Tax=Trichobilharzia regenti TaxID=157069 RepID=A0AA85J5H3_TRIRE|nr:unnamed protein product [Trichobilharzia regenti]